MKKIIFAISLLILALFFSFTCVYATENNMENVKNNVVDSVNNTGNVVMDTASGAAGAIKNGLNAIGNTTQNMSNDVMNAGNNAMNGMKNTTDNMMNDMNNAGNNMSSDFTATRTSTETPTDGNGAWTNNVWTWVIIGIIVVAIIGVIWYFVNQNNR